MPDIHWHIGEGQDQETIAATSPRRSRRSWIALAIVVVLGVGLGAMYRSLPEPAPRPTPAPSPTTQPTPDRPVVPARLYATIDEEAQALASGAIETVMAVHTPQDRQAAEWQRLNFRAWGRPNDGRPLYTIIDFNLRSQTKAWADVRQFRNGRWFRETRFYRWEKDRWLRSEVDPFFWSDQTETLDTPYFHVIYPVEDRAFIRPLMDQLEEVRNRLCADLDCEAAPLTYTLNLDSSINNGWPISNDGREIRFASPRVMGVYEDDAPLGAEGLNLIFALTWTTVQHIAYGQIPSYTDGRDAGPLLWAISNWATLRAAELSANWVAEARAELQKKPLSLERLWSVPGEDGSTTVYNLAYALVHFIAQEYGAPAVAKLLKSMATAASFANLIENALGVPFSEFDQKWQTWLNAAQR